MLLVKGLHPPLIDEDTFERAQEIMDSKGQPRSSTGKLTNPLAGLIRCGVCGRYMLYRPYSNRETPPSIICPTQGCPNVSSYFHYVEERLLQALKDWLNQYKAQWEKHLPQEFEKDTEKIKVHENLVKSLQNKLAEAEAQKNELHDLLERKIYTVEVFLERSQILAQRIEETKKALEEAQKELELERKRIEAKEKTIPQIEHVLEAYHQTNDPTQKNALLKSVLEYAVYKKEIGGRWSGLDDQFELILYPKLPK